jgi:tryptophan-rich sensory protein
VKHAVDVEMLWAFVHSELRRLKRYVREIVVVVVAMMVTTTMMKHHSVSQQE